MTSSQIPRQSHTLRNVVVSIIVLLIVIVVILYVILPIFSSNYNPVTQPDIQVTNVSASVSNWSYLSCLVNHESWTVSFTLVNSGNANGYATVGVYVDGSLYSSNNYFVPQGNQMSESASITSSCGSHSYSVEVLSESK